MKINDNSVNDNSVYSVRKIQFESKAQSEAQIKVNVQITA